jgi:hypothetical protein
MNSAVDLDINNYTIDDLYNFFKLPTNTSEDNISHVADKMGKNILNTSLSTDEKYSYINFIADAKQILKTHIETKNKVNLYDNILKKKVTNLSDASNDKKPYDNVGKIINPMSISHQSMQKISIPSDSVNPYMGNKLVTNYVFNTQFRDNYFFSQPSDATFTLPIKIKNVVAVSLSAVQIPNNFLTFSNIRGTNQIYIFEETTQLQGIVTIPNGNYDITSFPSILEEAINLQIIGSLPGRFKVTINPYNYFTTISNTTYNFRMNILRTNENFIGNCNSFIFNDDLNGDKPIEKNNTLVEKFVTTMGYIIGYRNFEYTGSRSYTSESMFNNVYCDYVFFCMNEFATASQYIANYGILSESLIDDNVLAIIPITSPSFTSTFDNNSNFIYKTRNYNSPIDIQKISIKILNPQGKLVNFFGNDYGFNLQITTLYDIMQPYTNDFSVL